MPEDTEFKQFEVGQDYYGRFTCNADNILTIRVERRTPKMILFREITQPCELGEPKRRKIRYMSDCETINVGPGITISAKHQVASK